MKVLVADKLDRQGVEILMERGLEVEVKTDLSPKELEEKIKDYDALIVRSATKVTEDIIKAADRLKVIGRAGVGIDNVDVEAATKKGIVVMNSPTGNTISAAEHALAMLLSLSRNVPQAHSVLKEKRWE
ncbi:MAG TPA: phosphoglycerate dehydrogenase, partial [Candidatus Omnitrophica bacterium]|nr:phosphoglycerate dehydrogenase [Candidatus Omnitrophota bacterium]